MVTSPASILRCFYCSYILIALTSMARVSITWPYCQKSTVISFTEEESQYRIIHMDTPLLNKGKQAYLVMYVIMLLSSGENWMALTVSLRALREWVYISEGTVEWLGAGFWEMHYGLKIYREIKLVRNEFIFEWCFIRKHHLLAKNYFPSLINRWANVENNMKENYLLL